MPRTAAGVMTGQAPSSPAVYALQAKLLTAGQQMTSRLALCYERAIVALYKRKDDAIIGQEFGICVLREAQKWQQRSDQLLPPGSELECARSQNPGAFLADVGTLMQRSLGLFACHGSVPVALVGTTGFVPPDAATLRAERALVKKLKTFGKCVRNCGQRQARISCARFGNGCKSLRGDDAFELDNCVQICHSKLAAAVRKIKGAPQCVHDNAPLAAAHLQTIMAGAARLPYCEDGGALDSGGCCQGFGECTNASGQQDCEYSWYVQGRSCNAATGRCQPVSCGFPFTCDEGEDCGNCPSDCACGNGETCCRYDDFDYCTSPDYCESY